MNITIQLTQVMDLTDVTLAQVPLATTAQELTGDWEGYRTRRFGKPVPSPSGLAPTQELGRELYRTGIEGFISMSAKVAHNRTLTIFPGNFKSGSFATFKLSGSIVHSITP